MKLLLEKGAEPEPKDNDGRTPLSWATKASKSARGWSRESYEAVVKLLLEKGAEKDVLFEMGIALNPFFWALRSLLYRPCCGSHSPSRRGSAARRLLKGLSWAGPKWQGGKQGRARLYRCPFPHQLDRQAIESLTCMPPHQVYQTRPRELD